MSNRRFFIRNFLGWAGATSFLPFMDTKQGQHLQNMILQANQVVPKDLATHDEFWWAVRNAYTVSSSLINLNNGGVSPQPKVVQEAVERYNRLSNETPTYYMWRILEKGKKTVRRKLAELGGVSSEEIAINRNTTEALHTLVFGLRLSKGDEVVLSKYDYPSMVYAWKQRALRDGIVLKWADISVPTTDKAALVRGFTSQFTAKTKVVQLTHMINWSGQVLPVADIGAVAQSRGIEVIVDAAHTFGQLVYKIPDLNCDYLGTSLHKWLCAPFGSGMLYVKKSRIAKLYPLFSAQEPESEDIRKFENLGTRSLAIEEAIGQAIDFHHMIGGQRKFERLHYLKNYWMEALRELPTIQFQTPLEKEFSGAIGVINIKGKDPRKIASSLFRDYNIHVTTVERENLLGMRVTPNVYTTQKELDYFVEAIRNLAS